MDMKTTPSTTKAENFDQSLEIFIESCPLTHPGCASAYSKKLGGIVFVFVLDDNHKVIDVYQIDQATWDTRYYMRAGDHPGTINLRGLLDLAYEICSQSCELSKEYEKGESSDSED